MKQFNFTKTVGTVAVFTVLLLSMVTKAQAQAGNSSAAVAHACVNKAGAIRIVGVKEACKAKESLLKLALVGATYSLGDDGPGGGIVYYVDGSGEHGLEAQVADEPTTLDWSSAVTAAAAYGAGWHLPTQTELALLYEQNTVVGGFADDYYWSSTESNSSYAWTQHLSSGLPIGYYVKSSSYRVRAVRAF